MSYRPDSNCSFERYESNSLYFEPIVLKTDSSSVDNVFEFIEKLTCVRQLF